MPAVAARNRADGKQPARLKMPGQLGLGLHNHLGHGRLCPKQRARGRVYEQKRPGRWRRRFGAGAQSDQEQRERRKPYFCTV